MIRASPRPHVSRLVRARRLLAGALDDHRAIVGTVSPEWIASEVERRVRRSDLPLSVRDHGELRDDSVAAHRDHWINTNRLPKLEPTVNAAVLVGALLYGQRLYGAGTPDPDEGVTCREMDNDLIVAAMVHDAVGRRDHVGWRPGAPPVLTDESLEQQLGAGVMRHLRAVRLAVAAFEEALARGATGDLKLEAPLASAVAAIRAAQLRLTARAAGDGILATLDPAKRDELRQAGIDPDPPGEPFPERPFLERDRVAASAAVQLDGVDHGTLRLPIEGQLLRSVENVLDRGVPPGQLAGRFGDAVAHFHAVLPLTYRYSPIIRRTARRADGTLSEVEGPYALGTLHLTGLEAGRYLHKVRRKGPSTSIAHSFAVAARMEPLLAGGALVSALAASDCHDVVEDGGRIVAGYDHGLQLFAARFGSPLAALVAEVTDSITCADGPLKAAAFRDRAALPLPEELYNVGQLEELKAVATNPDVPYTLHGAMLKLADAGVTQEEGLRSPEAMCDAWGYSGARVHWNLYSKGLIVRPLLERLCLELEASRHDAFYPRRVGSLDPQALLCLGELLSWFLDTTDAYAAQNIWMLAGEYRLDAESARQLVSAFFDRTVPPAAFEELLESRLDDARLDERTRREGWPATFRLTPEGPVRDLDKLGDYRDTARWRSELRRRIGAAPLDPGLIVAARETLRSMHGTADSPGQAD